MIRYLILVLISFGKPPIDADHVGISNTNTRNFSKFQGVKTVTYVNPVISKANSQATVTTSSTASLQPLRVTQYAYTQTGNFVRIQNFNTISRLCI